MSMSSCQFSMFVSLPPELQLQVWSAAIESPAMHVFEICLPPEDSNEASSNIHRSRMAFTSSTQGPMTRDRQLRFDKFNKTAFFDAVLTSDPSMYRWQRALAQTCVDAALTMAKRAPIEPINRSQTAQKGRGYNTVYLPGCDRHVSYDNSMDVLHLRLPTGPGSSTAADTLLCPSRRSSPSGIGKLLDAQWSDELASTIQQARFIAFDVVDTWTDVSVGPLIMEEVAFLACTLQHDLEVIYLVDNCAGRCSSCGKKGVQTKEMQTRGSELDRELHGTTEQELARKPDVVQGVGVTYREVFELEKLGWDTYHPTYVFARILDDAIRAQQRDGLDASPFRGVRILVSEHDQ
jgi:hypothetical protein